MYNTTNITNANDLLEVYSSVNLLSNGLLSSFFIFVLFLIILVVFKGRYELGQILIGDGFICTFIGIIMMTLGFASWSVIVIPLIGLFVGTILVLFNG